MLRVTPIYGSSLSSAAQQPTSDNVDDDPLEWLSSPTPSCTLVEYAGMKLLLNAGWDESLPTDGSGVVAIGNTRSSSDDDNTATAAADGSSSNNNNNSNKPIIPETLPNVDAILLCDSTLPSLGGLPRYFGASKNSKRGRVPRSFHGTKQQKKQQRNPPFLATYPTVKMGQMTLYDHHASLSLDGSHPGYSLEDVDAVFGKESVHTLKYSQTVYLPLEDDDDYYGGGGGGEDNDGMDIDQQQQQQQQQNNKQLSNSKTSKKLLAITPHLSGHVVGGCYWVLRQLSDDTEIILAPTYHHAKEKHLAGSTLHKFAVNADALLTTPGGPRGLLGKLYQPPSTNKHQTTNNNTIIKYNKGNNKPILSPPIGNRSEAQLLESIMAALRRDGNVLLPVDASGRILELLLILDKQWERQRLSGAYNLVWVGPMSFNTIEFARSQLEWMAEPLGAQFDSQRGHPYGLKCIKICSSIDELDGVMERSNGNPTCVLASGATLDHGPARDLLIRWGSNPDNLVLITDSTRCVPRGNVWYNRRCGAGGRHRRGGVGGGGGGGDAPSIVHQANKEKEAAAAAILTAAVVEEGPEADEDGNPLLGAPILPSEISAYTTASQLLYAWCTAKASREEMADEVAVDVYVPHRAPLAGLELKAFLAEEEEERRLKIKEEEEKAMMMEIELARGRLRLGDDDTGGGGASSTGASSGKTGASTAVGSKTTKSGGGTAGGGSSRPKKKSRFDQNLFIKFSKPVHMTFSVREEAVGIGQPDSIAKYGIGESVGQSNVLEDDYGIAVKSEAFVDIVTGVDPSKFAGKSGRIGEEVMRRGLGFGSDGRPVGMDAGELGDNAMKEGDGDEAINEKMLEVADLSSGKGIIKGRNGRLPLKVSVIPRRLEVLAEVVYTPLEGRVDARAARQSVRALQPRHLVVIGGPKSNSLLLADALRTTTTTSSGSSSNDPSKHGGSLAHIPVDGETVQLTVGHAAYGVRLIDTPYLTQTEKEEMELTGQEIEPVEPHEAKIGDCTVSLVDYVATGKKWAVDGSIVLAPRQQKMMSLKQPSLMLSTREVLLTDLRAEVTALGMKAQYGALSGYSQLIVNGKIFVRKDNATGKLDVEGPLCDDFYTVRSVVCSQYVTI
ncbi:hypothetical protein ACHAXR_011246 [Thalassiosira sp. AJA248-18]